MADLTVQSFVDDFMAAADTAAARTVLGIIGGTLSSTEDVLWTSGTFDGTGNVTAAATLATVNGNVGTFAIPTITVNAKGLITAVTAVTALTGLTDLGLSMANNTASTGFALGTISDTTSRPFNITQTWNNSGLTATALKVNVTNTSSAAGSLIADFQVGGTSAVGIHKNGYVTVAASASPYYLLYLDSTRHILTPAGGMLQLGSAGLSVNSNNSQVYLAGNLAFGPSFAGSQSNADLFLFRAAAASLQLGNDAASPVAQILGACNATGTDHAGATFTIKASNGTGTGGSGAISFQTAATGSTGSTANTLRAVLTLKASGVLNCPTMPTSSSGLSAGDIYSNLGVLTIV